MNKSQRIPIDPNTPSADSHIIVKLDQEVDTLEFLSMNLGVNDVYQNFNADYGVLIGRVIANGGIGIANAKISIFIPLDSADANIGEIASIYPYIQPTDKNNDGKRYNLLPRVAQIDPKTGISSPKQPFGSFPIKPELVTNSEFMEVYKKYYKYTALTNNSGDYMIFGVPTGTQTVHLSVDITDIGKYSMNPAAMVTNLGYSPNLFTDNGSKIKPSTDLGDLPNIETQEISVDIAPFWGDTTNFTIGITRQDFRIRSVLVNTFVIFGSAFTDSEDTIWGKDVAAGRKINELNISNDDQWAHMSIYTKRIGKITEKIYYYPASITDAQINSGNVDPTKDMLLLDSSEYSAYKREGDFAFIINCNRNKVITDEFGGETPISETSTNGVFTKFRGFVTLEIAKDDVPMNYAGTIGGGTVVVPFRYRLKFPQYATRNTSFERPVSGADTNNTKNWRKEHCIFENNKYYSFSRFHGTTYLIENASHNNPYEDGDLSESNGFWQHDNINSPYNHNEFYDVGNIFTNNMGADYTGNDQYEFPHNTYDNNNNKVFGANWLNLSIYLPQIGFITNGYSTIKYVRGTDNFTRQTKQSSDNGANKFFFYDNLQAIAGGQFNTRGFARADLQWTDIIEVPITDIISMKSVTKKGFTDLDPAIPLTTNKYRNGVNVPLGWSSFGACPLNGGKFNGFSGGVADQRTYFYKGFGSADCIDFLYDLGIIT